VVGENLREDTMIDSQPSDCLGTILDMICYEFVGRRLSPEVGQLLEEHLKECPRCRSGVKNFLELISREQAVETIQ
jgi:hypothetical protein